MSKVSLKSIYRNILILRFRRIHLSVSLHRRSLYFDEDCIRVGHEECCINNGQIYSVTVQPNESIEAELILVPAEVCVWPSFCWSTSLSFLCRLLSMISFFQFAPVRLYSTSKVCLKHRSLNQLCVVNVIWVPMNNRPCNRHIHRFNGASAPLLCLIVCNSRRKNFIFKCIQLNSMLWNKELISIVKKWCWSTIVKRRFIGNWIWETMSR